ncbi:DNA-binding protein [Natrinema saccharevitans]|uniref:DNA-binding protein n=1 Tax=Natrinema saccharevitans TaxID=301967 RepID=A0A1S8AZM5_9EURY|nr:helix-turn-helix domain-containing protein [Natrinema saccharevitans]OLZ42263.1 DNA-binding protein [Natrinema saccharevitans]
MTSIAEFTLAPADFPLGRVFEERPEVALDLDRVVPSGDTVMPYFWVQDPDEELAAIRRLFDGLPELRSAVLMEDLGDRGLYRAEWKPEYMGIMRAIAETGVTVVSATGTRTGWVFELRAGSVDRFSAFQQYCTDHDIEVTLTRLNRLSEMTAGAEYGLTPDQREALLLAYNRGYYSDARETDQATLADELGISRQAFSSRLRRGYRNLIEGTIVGDPRSSDQPYK